MTDGAPPLDMRENGEEEARAHFLRNIRKMAGSAVLMRRYGDGRLGSVFASEGFARMMECTQEEALRRMDGTGFFHSVHPKDRPLVRGKVKRCAAGTGGGELTIRMLTAAGKQVWCRALYSFIDDFGGHYIYCAYTDVTMLKIYEERLRSVYLNLGVSFHNPNERTLALFRVNLTRDVIEDARGRDLYPTDSAEYPYSEVLARRAEHYPLAAEREHFLHTFARDRLRDGYQAGRVRAWAMLYSRRPDGRLCFVEFTAILTRHPLSGDVIAFITEQECNDEKVRETLMKEILVRQFDMVAYLAEGRYGVTIGDAKRITKGGIFPASRSGDYRRYLDEQVLPALSGNDEYRESVARALSLESIRERTRHDEPYEVNVAIDIDGEIFHKRFDFYSVVPGADFYVVLKSDVTELRREQEAQNDRLRAALREARQASVAKTAFLSSMSHEIRTPMNAIIGLDNIALNDPEISGRTRERLEKIGDSARHLLGLINDILDMSRIESGRMTLKNEEFSFRSMLEQINTMIGGQVQDRGLEYECRVIGPLSEYYIGDDMKLKQVLINILGNAVKFTPAPGTVTFTIEQTARYQEQSALRFIISDTGIGMDKEYLPRLFDAFTQEDATTTNKYGGSGLGMAITKNIVGMMNGSISVDSEKGAGTTFTVNVTLRNSDRPEILGADLPPRETDEPVVDDGPAARGHAKTAAILASRRVLLAEDMLINAEIMRELLEMMDMEVEHAENGRIAVETFSNSPEGRFDAILMDMRMPEMDGLAATEAIRALDRPDAKAVPIIALTANAFDEDVQRSLQVGMNAHLSKPVEPKRLYETLGSLIRS